MSVGMFNIKHVLIPDPTNPYAAFNIVYFVSLVLGIWSWLVIVRYVHNVSMGEKPDFGTILRLAGWSDLFYIITVYHMGDYLSLHMC